MSNTWEINAKSVLVMSDAHQNIAWIRRIMDHEKGNFDRFLFNGDIIHTRESRNQVAGTRETARFYKYLIDNYDVNRGNHELPIMESWSQNSQFRNRKHLINGASGYTKSNSLHFNRYMDWTDWRKVTLFRLVNGVLVSHAGFGQEEWGYGHYYNSTTLDKIWNDSQSAFDHISVLPNELFRVGPSRNSSSVFKTGGPVWRDWDTEFDINNVIPFTQIVGHTTTKSPVEYKYRSFNIDHYQSTYAIIRSTGTIQFKYIKDNQIVTAPITQV